MGQECESSETACPSLILNRAIVCDFEMPSSNLPDELDKDRIAEVALALLSLTLHDDRRVWKGIDWDVLDLLHEKGWILDSHTSAKSVVLTRDGERLAEEFLQKHFARQTSAGQ